MNKQLPAGLDLRRAGIEMPKTAAAQVVWSP